MHHHTYHTTHKLRTAFASARATRLLNTIFFQQSFFRSRQKLSQTKTTVFNGCLGSQNDEERSKMRYVM